MLSSNVIGRSQTVKFIYNFTGKWNIFVILQLSDFKCISTLSDFGIFFAICYIRGLITITFIRLTFFIMIHTLVEIQCFLILKYPISKFAGLILS